MIHLLRTAIALAFLVGFTYVLRRWGVELWGSPLDLSGRRDPLGIEYSPLPGHLVRAAASIGLLLLGAFLSGRLFSRLGLAAVTGYLLFGVLVGPDLLQLIRAGEIQDLSLVNDLAIALIALTAGGEIRLSFLRHAWKQVATVAGAAVGGVALGSFVVLLGILPLAGIVDEALSPLGIALAAIGATIAAANSPAVVIAVVTEAKATSDMSRLALSVTVCKDLLLVVLFTIVLAVAAGQLVQEAGEHESIIRSLALHLGGSIIVGILVGLAMAFYMHVVRSQLAFFIILGGFGIALLSESLHLETLIVAVVAGMLMENLWPKEAEPLFERIEELSLPVYCVFFAVTGLNVNVEALGDVWMWALSFVAARALLVWLVTTGACHFSGADPTSRRWLWTALIPQAGIALALASIVDETLESSGVAAGPFVEFLVAVIAVHQLIGPALFKLGLGRADATPEQTTARANESSD